ncbi:MFS transporter [Mesorhizobium sp.]|uniref:MFS transporter n=1 Tax=Mesorhizobium sp. TaxID=1871066 RepID=UPI00257B39BC|nr:MFS transporter [Mesorhizobium sp.]
MQCAETFRTPTWTDYLCLHHRLTEADKELDEHLLRLACGRASTSNDVVLFGDVSPAFLVKAGFLAIGLCP